MPIYLLITGEESTIRGKISWGERIMGIKNTKKLGERWSKSGVIGIRQSSFPIPTRKQANQKLHRKRREERGGQH